MWTEMIDRLAPDATFGPPATGEAIQACEQTLGHPLTDELVELLREADGVEGEYGLGLVWSLERIASDNMALRTGSEYNQLYMPFEPLLFFADAGNGDQFAFVLRNRRRDVFAWNHEDDSRSWAAPDLASYLTWWLTGRIKL